MCGIAGIIKNEPLIEDDIVLMCTALRHRGPDAQGVFLNSARTVGLGHRRLSVIDLTDNANQPMRSTDQRFVVVFNGEIYNFKQIRQTLQKSHAIAFTTDSDTEVIIASFRVWGVRAVDRWEGMFAVALYDQIEEKVYFFRDRVGKKPLFYFVDKNVFAFASEIKALLAYPYIARTVSINRKVIGDFLHLGYMPEPYTIYSQIHRFKAGHYGELSLGQSLTLQPYWSVRDVLSPPEPMNENEAKSRLRNLVSSAVKQRLVSDVPVGAFLSGGTDSSLVTALAAEHSSKPLKTFSIGFNNSPFDERKYASEVARIIGTSHTEYLLHEKEAFNILDTYLNHFDEPFADTSAIPTMLVAKLARQEVTVALTGDGGDELFLGYGAYRWADRLESQGWRLMRPLVRASLIASQRNEWLRVAHLLAPVPSVQHKPSHIFSQEQSLFSQREIQELFREPSDVRPFEYIQVSGNLSAGERQALFDFEYYLKDDLLVKVDRASMYYALECRSPLLDHHVVKFAFSLQRLLKHQNGTSKWILKQLLREFLPDELVYRKKWGFSVPLEKWLRGDLRYMVNDYLNQSVVDKVALFRFTVIQNLVDLFFKGRYYLYNRIWVLIVLHKWMLEHQSRP